ncbi:MAG: class I tRNA ligase family protein [Lentisphaeria bacterium]|nr:class I tRNA ligase family protein [Lentisphaeria bacterium]
MSKSLKNVVNPDEVIDEYGADSFRLYEMFMGPLEASKPWNTDSVSGVSRFLNKAWRMIVAEDGSLAPEIGDHAMTPDQERILHQSIKKVDEDTASLDFNTAISQMMVFVNEFGTAKERNKDAMVSFVLMLSSYAPHIAEEFWVILGKEEGISYIPFPSYDESKLVVDEVEILLQSKGKPKARIMMSPNMSKEEMEKAALEIPEVQEIIDGKEIIKMICVPGRLINIVTKG